MAHIRNEIRTLFCLLFADFEQQPLKYISAEIRPCALQYVFLSTKSAVGFWSHYALELVEKVVLKLHILVFPFLKWI